MKITVAVNWAGLLIFAVSGVVLNMFGAAEARSDKGEDDDSEIRNLLGVRPDLADNLNPVDIEKPDMDINEPGAAAGAMPGTEAPGVKAQKEGLDCVKDCLLTDQSCRARCLGVPGVASRKMPRKQDIEGNLPLNWKKNNKEEIVKPASVDDVSGASGTHVASAEHAAVIEYKLLCE
ncbi:hypothetical protein LPJ64_002024 [Coemansia asiatica]|uniref:Uncharacterized protein n=1 Tax=Coemansia asiatica TaxID=1052880 RepID=A0A9W7XNW7_9FUNG|nr:hypothetical protein LPJ64_002024 [Coemansia asiatica]